MEEQWKQHSKGFWVSNYGNVKRKNLELVEFNPLYKRKSFSGIPANRLVYSLFVGEIPPQHYVYHRDTDTENNKVENLFLLSPQEKLKKAKPPTKHPSWVSFEEFVIRSQQVHGNKYDYIETTFSRMSKKVTIKCPCHGNYEQIASDHVNGHGCYKCQKESRKTWSEKEDEYLINNYKDLGIARCANTLGKTNSAISSRAVTLGITKKVDRLSHKYVPAALWSGLVSRANDINRGERSGLDFDIDYVWQMFLKQNGKCALSGWEIKMNRYQPDNSASVDRIDSNRGYLKDNVQLVHKDINRMKNHFSEEYFIKACCAISQVRGT